MTRVGSVITGLGGLGLAIGETVAGPGVAGVVFVWGMAVVFGLVLWRIALVPYLKLTPDGVIVQNPLRRTVLAYSDIKSVKADSVLFLGRHRATDLGVWAVQKPNWAMWSKRHTRADHVAALLQARLSR